MSIIFSILFMINNISISNMEAKAKEFNEVIQEQYYPWFAQYMVMKRASIEPNFHDLYLKFFDKVNSKSLNKEILKATYENCKFRGALLAKNLGSWLGKFTIGRNQALRAKEIDPKSLIVEAYEKGLMIAVIPFTSKILEPCQSSIAYRPPNPWTMGILSLLAEIYNLPNLKMNLKFDIEPMYATGVVPGKVIKYVVAALHWGTGHKNDCLQIISSSAASNSVLPTVGKVPANTSWPEFEIKIDYEGIVENQMPKARIIKFDVGNMVMVTGGRNTGCVGVIKNREKHKGNFETIHVLLGAFCYV
ncbi:CCR4-NOT transcription complex subunit 1 [Zea mays]|uniref:CCR4-NOT transcription complex subunit 1 n=1 Tax=Zea mays TaxID=4577 RepID=A0A3L6D7R4_MAIZE|nr:CCR4-NOT transcription complex subunit 1 [Zea mays]